MAVVCDPMLSPSDLIQNQAQRSERRKAARAQEMITQSLIKQDSQVASNSQYTAKKIQATLKENYVCKAGDDIDNIWTFKNTSSLKIPFGIKFVMVAGDEELNQPGIHVKEDVAPGEFFKLYFKMKAPSKNKHYSAGYMLIDHQGNYFGDKVVINFMVESDSSQSIVL